MRERMVQIEWTQKEALMNTAAAAIATIMINHPEFSARLTKEEAAIFLKSSYAIACELGSWRSYLLKQHVYYQNFYAPEEQ